MANGTRAVPHNRKRRRSTRQLAGEISTGKILPARSGTGRQPGLALRMQMVLPMIAHILGGNWLRSKSGTRPTVGGGKVGTENGRTISNCKEMILGTRMRG